VDRPGHTAQTVKPPFDAVVMICTESAGECRKVRSAWISTVFWSDGVTVIEPLMLRSQSVF
jgi:hypothetical protein